jgi:hypothetical protein
MLNRLRFTPARLGAIEQRELIGLVFPSGQHPASQPSASTQLSGGGPRSAGRRGPPRRSRRSRGQLYRRRRRGRANRDHAWDDHKSRRWRHGNSKSDKAVTQSYRVTAWFRMRRGSRLQAASGRAALSLACAVVQRRRGRRCGGERRHEASARLHALWRGSVGDAVATARGLRGLMQAP